MKSICVFCGSNFGSDPAYEEATRSFGKLLAQSGRSLVYGGGRIGLMGVIADSVLENGGHVIGVIPEVLVDKEQAHPNLSQLEVVSDMRERKARMAELSDAFVALPGGLGTYEELFEMLSWAQLRLHEKPIGVLNTLGFYDSLLQMLNTTVSAGFMREANRSLLVAENNGQALLNALENYQPSHSHKWLARGEKADQV